MVICPGLKSDGNSNCTHSGSTSCPHAKPHEFKETDGCDGAFCSFTNKRMVCQHVEKESGIESIW